MVLLATSSRAAQSDESYVLVVGGGGYIGACTALHFVEQGRKVIILDWHEDQQGCREWATYFIGDYGDKAVLEDIFSTYHIDSVMLFAGFIEVGESVKNPLRFYENNVAKSVTLLQVMIKHNVKKLVFSSSCAVYGIPHTLPLCEDHPKKPISPYGKTKQVIEMILEDLAARDHISYVALRYFNAAGACPEKGLGERHDPETHIIPLLLRAAMQGRPFKIFGSNYPTPDGTCIRDFLHVTDIAYAHSRALAYLEAGGASSALNLGTGQGVSVREMVTLVEKVVGKKVMVVDEPRRAGDPAVLVADASKAREILQWQPCYSSIERIIRDAYAFELIKQ